MVEALYDGYMKPGDYSFEWSASSYASGIYFIKFQSGTFIQTQKVTLLK